jgi:hypothetical protein
MNLKELLFTFGEGAKLQLAVGVSAGVIGIIVSMLVLPGLPLKIGSFAVMLSQGNLVVLMFLMIITSYIFGIGARGEAPSRVVFVDRGSALDPSRGLPRAQTAARLRRPRLAADLEALRRRASSDRRGRSHKARAPQDLACRTHTPSVG